ncbi:MAG TPA: hypothetical protein VNZ52_17100 [Candidatus Thermoplasmatota archaeon]|nr:hypothetical protein [Candidatus Thermoplasmatota archaeon]
MMEKPNLRRATQDLFLRGRARGLGRIRNRYKELAEKLDIDIIL